MVRITFYVGQTDPQGQPLTAVAKEWHEAQEALLKAYGGFSMTNVLGGWFSPITQRVLIETTIVVSVLTVDDDPIKAVNMAKKLKGLFQQEAVLYTMEEVKGAFV